jgi:uncharacterized membrane protein HdeD (DUF308 family)
MTNVISSVLAGAVAMASLVAALFFLKFWRQTRDGFFFMFAVAFALDAVARFVLGLAHVSDETEPLFYVPRLVTFTLIILAIIHKNRPGRRIR